MYIFKFFFEMPGKIVKYSFSNDYLFSTLNSVFIFRVICEVFTANITNNALFEFYLQILFYTHYNIHIQDLKSNHTPLFL